MTETIFKTGALLKSFHFEPMSDRPDRYVIGEITGVRDGAIHFRVLADVVDDGPCVQITTPGCKREIDSRVEFWLTKQNKPWSFDDQYEPPEEMFTPLPGKLLFGEHGRRLGVLDLSADQRRISNVEGC